MNLEKLVKLEKLGLSLAAEKAGPPGGRFQGAIRAQSRGLLAIYLDISKEK
jgi:hypothetical protein